MAAAIVIRSCSLSRRRTSLPPRRTHPCPAPIPGLRSRSAWSSIVSPDPRGKAKSGQRDRCSVSRDGTRQPIDQEPGNPVGVRPESQGPEKPGGMTRKDRRPERQAKAVSVGQNGEDPCQEPRRRCPPDSRLLAGQGPPENDQERAGHPESRRKP